MSINNQLIDVLNPGPTARNILYSIALDVYTPLKNAYYNLYPRSPEGVLIFKGEDDVSVSFYTLCLHLGEMVKASFVKFVHRVDVFLLETPVRESLTDSVITSFELRMKYYSLSKRLTGAVAVL